MHNADKNILSATICKIMLFYCLSQIFSIFTRYLRLKICLHDAMNSKRALLIINPISGTRSKKGLEELVTLTLGKKGIDVTAYYTKSGGDAYSRAKAGIEEGFEIIISAGGDGTVNEIANAVSGTDAILGILPYGSGNGLARSLSIPISTPDALKIVDKGNVMECDRGIANGHPFYCTLGLGFDATVSERFAIMGKRGRNTYIRSAFREYFKYKSESYALLIDGKIITEKALLIAVCNAPQYGNNAYIGPHAKLQDGLLDITVVHEDTPLSTLLMGMALMAGTIDKNKNIECIRTSSVSIARLNPGPVHIDGEPMLMGKKIDITCQKRVLKVFAPLNSKEFQPVISPLRALLNDMRYDVMEKFRTGLILEK